MSASRLEVGLSVRVGIDFGAAVERSPLRLVLEEAHGFDILYRRGYQFSPSVMFQRRDS